MSDPASALLGSWEKITRSACSELYPDRLQLRAGGLYSGERDPAGTFSQWDAGTYRVTGPGRIAISTANDAIVAYGYALAGDRLEFTGPDRCVFAYRRRS